MAKRGRRPSPAYMHLGHCRVCGRVRYSTKKIAKAAARQLHPGRHQRAFQCSDYWHIAPAEPISIRGARPTLTVVDEAVTWEAS